MKLRPGSTLPDSTRRAFKPVGFYWQNFRGQWILRRVPRRRPAELTQLELDNRADMKRLADALRDAPAWDRIYAEALAYHTQLAWRDVLSLTMIGRFVYAREALPPMDYPDLDMIGVTPGSLVFRDTANWLILPPGIGGQVLTMDGGMPNWRTPSTAGGGGASGGLFAGLIPNVPTIASTGLSGTFGSSGTITEHGSGISIDLAPASGSAMSAVQEPSAPGGSYKRTALVAQISGDGDGTNNPIVGIGWNDGTKVHFVGVTRVSATQFPYIQVWRGSNSSTLVTTDYSAQRQEAVAPYTWFQIEDDGTTVYFRHGVDGVNFRTLYSVAKSSGYLGSGGYTHPMFFSGGFANNDGVHKIATLFAWS